MNKADVLKLLKFLSENDLLHPIFHKQAYDRVAEDYARLTDKDEAHFTAIQAIAESHFDDDDYVDTDQMLADLDTIIEICRKHTGKKSVLKGNAQ